jgi:hypothetical protein
LIASEAGACIATPAPKFFFELEPPDLDLVAVTDLPAGLRPAVGMILDAARFGIVEARLPIAPC